MANLKDLIVNGSARILGNLYATLKGNADTATKLETARTIRTNLGSTSAVGFDGSANITPGIQGTLPVANGGTGQTSIANIQAGKDADGNVISTTYATKTELETDLNTVDGKISNCILEIPERLKIELVDGHPVIKAGSKIPMIGSTYSETTLTSDYTINFQTSWQESDGLIFYIPNSGYQQTWGFVAMNRTLSGDTLPTGLTGNTYLWFDTVNKVYKGTTDGGRESWTDITVASYPLAAVHFKDGVVTEILKDFDGNDMIFNGLGFIGQTKFIYPNVKVLESIGYNSDGTLKSREFTNNSIQLSTSGGTYNRRMFLNGDSFQVTVNPWYYNKDTNLWYDQNNVPFTNGCICLGDCFTVNDDITNFTVRQPVKLATTEMMDKIDGGTLLPNFDTMPVLQTIEFDTADTSWHKIMERTNTESSSADLNDVIYFRITVTGTDINQVGNYALILPGRIGVQPRWIVQMFPGTTSTATSGVRYIRAIYPKNLNNGYGWAIEIINTRNTNARHYKIEVFKTNSKITWLKGVASTYTSTYQSNLQIEVEMRNGYVFDYMYGQVTQSDNATRLNNALSKYLNSTMHTAGAALTNGSFVYQNGNNLYPGTDKTKAIEPGFGIQWNSYSYSSGNSIGWDQIKQKLSVTSLTNVPHDTLVRGNPCYFRCTMDANGNILSDNYVTTSMANGYTWYYVGLAQSATAIAIDTTQSFFITLDSNGKVTHINGKQVGGSGGTVDQTYDATSANAQSGVAINGAKFLQNQTSSTYALRLSPGNDSTMPNGNYSIAIGKSTGAQGANATSIGYYATATGDYSVAIGASAQTTSKSGIQIGRGANVTPYTLSVGFTLSDDSVVSYRLLEGTTGKIPDDRLNTTIARTSNVYTKTETDNNFYSKTDTEVVHTVIETYQNGTNWYRVYDDGWVEQGGRASVSYTGTDVELLREFTDTNYTVVACSAVASTAPTINVFAVPKNVTTITLGSGVAGASAVSWYACGYGAEVFYI